MHKKFLMGNNDGIVRSKASPDATTVISPRLRTKLTTLAIIKSMQSFSEFFGMSAEGFDYDQLAAKYEAVADNAVSLEMFIMGSIQEKDHINFWCLNQLYHPEVYLESGVFIGSSMHAFADSPTLKETVAIDPNIHKLRVRHDRFADLKAIRDSDFSELTMDHSGKKSVAYFDDHIDPASRILQAHEKGFRYVVFDDATGLEGLCQRLYPAVPTIPMIVNPDLYQIRDSLSWTYKKKFTMKALMKKLLMIKGGEMSVRLDFIITDTIRERCDKANSVIVKHARFPDLSDFVAQSRPRFMCDTTKYILELKQ